MAGGNGAGRDDAFYALVLSGIGAPINQANLSVLRAWARVEGGSASWNPFNTTQNAQGATAYNSNNGTPVRNYSSEQQGVAATVQTLKSGYYKVIVAGLKASNPLMAIAGIVASPWDGHYGARANGSGGYDFTTSSLYKAWSSTQGSSAALPNLPSGLTSGSGSGGVAYYDPLTTPTATIVGPDGTIYAPFTNYIKDVPAATRAGIRIVVSPGYVSGQQANQGAGKDPGAVQEITPGTVVGDTAASVASGLAPIGAVFGWLSANMSRVGLGLLGVLLLIFGVIYTQKGTIKETVMTAAKLAPVAA